MMDEFVGVMVLGLAMTAVVAVLAAALRWKQGQGERTAARVTSFRRTASPGPLRPSPALHNLDAGAPDPVDFAGTEPVMGRRGPGGSSET